MDFSSTMHSSLTVVTIYAFITQLYAVISAVGAGDAAASSMKFYFFGKTGRNLGKFGQHLSKFD